MAVKDGAGVTEQSVHSSIFARRRLSGSAQVTGNLVSLAITPDASSVVLGLTKTLTCTATYTTGATENVTSKVTWSTSDAGIASAPAASGVSTSAGLGTATITATLGTVSDTTTLQVTAKTVSRVAVTPPGAGDIAGGTAQFTATATYSDGTTADVSATATWQSSDTGVATINGTGLATAVATGETTITATLTAVSGTATYIVYTTSNTVDPVLTVVSPNPAASPGEPGGFPADYTAAKDTPIVLDITDVDPGIGYVTVTAREANGVEKVVYRNGAFRTGYQANSSQNSITNGVRLSVRADDGWPEGGVYFEVDAIDGDGNLT